MSKVQVLSSWRSVLDEVTPSNKRISDKFLVIDDFNITQAHRKPFSIDVICVIICREGVGQVFINNKIYHFKSNDMVIFLPDQVIQYIDNKNIKSIRAIVFERTLFDNVFPNDMRGRLFTETFMHPIISLSPKELQAIDRYYALIMDILQYETHQYREKTIQHLTAALFYSYFIHRHNQSIVEQSRTNHIFNQFLELLRKHYKTETQVSFYADKLCLTPKYLSRIVKMKSGQLASEWIDNFLIMEAKLLLANTDLTISQISEELNFSNTSSFGKFFKKKFQLTPTEYRKKCLVE